MSVDPARSALLRLARELDLDPLQHPDHIATGVIRHIHRQKASNDTLEALLSCRQHRFESLEGDTHE